MRRRAAIVCLLTISLVGCGKKFAGSYEGTSTTALTFTALGASAGAARPEKGNTRVVVTKDGQEVTFRLTSEGSIPLRLVGIAEGKIATLTPGQPNGEFSVVSGRAALDGDALTLDLETRSADGTMTATYHVAAKRTD